MIGMKLPKNFAASVLGLLVVVLLGACGGGGGGGGLPPGGGDATEAPSAEIIFPPAVSLTDGERVTVRGTAADNDAIAAVRVNGVDATSTDGFATWQASVPLALGPNTLTVETVDMASNVNPAAAEVLINRDVLWAEPVAIALDSANNRALVVDGGLDAVIAVNLTDGKRTMVSKASTPEGAQANLVSSPQGIALDSTNNRALVVDAGLRAVVAVDLATGARTIVSGPGKPVGGAHPFSLPQAIALDGARALVVDSGLDAVVAVDLTDGTRTIVSGAGTPADGATPFSSPVAIALDGARALVVDDSLRAVLEVDLTTGAREIVSNADVPLNGTNQFGRPVAIAFDSANNRALVVDEALGAVVDVNLDDGARTIVSDGNKPVGGANPFSLPRAIALDSANRALVVDSVLDSMMGVDLATGARTVVSNASTPNGANPLIGPAGIGLDSANNRALVIDTSLRAVVAVDLDDGARTIVSNDTTPNAANTFSFPVAITLDSANSRALVADGNLKGVLAVNLDDGARTIVSDANKPVGGANPFSFPQAIALDSANRALVVDAGPHAVLAVDLASGTRTIVSSNVDMADNPFIDPVGIAIDSANTRALVLEASAPDMNLRGVVEVNLDNGTRTPLSSNMGIPDDANPFRFPRAIALDGANNRALVVDAGFAPGLDAVLAVDLTSGARTVVSNATTPNGANPFSSAQAIAVDGANNRALVVDNEWSGVFMVDLLTGERVLFSK